MSIGGGGGSQTTTSTQTLDPQIKQLIMQNVQGAKDIAGKPFEAYTGQMTAGLDPNQQAAISAAPSLLSAGQDTVGKAILGAQGAGNNVAGGISAYQNPYQDQVIKATMGDLERQRQIAQTNDRDAIAKAGAFGNNRVGVMQANTNEAYDRTAADTLARLRSSGFDTAAGLAQQDASRGLQGTALLGTLGGQQQQMQQNGINSLLTTGSVGQQTNQAGLDAQLQEFMRRIGYDAQGQQLINQSLGLLPQTGTNTTTSPKPDNTAGLLGGLGSVALGAAKLIPLLSDVRCKDDIVTVGYDEAGRRWTTWRYKWEPEGTRHFGLIAQEAMETDPDAVFEGEDGFLRIDYSKLTVH